MKPRDAVRPVWIGGAWAALATLLATAAPAAFVIAGPPLGIDQRDVRVFDNFADPSANDNTTPHPQFPGFTGAELALWKAVVEWGSEPHGSGAGDPTQPVLGSGGANFDPTWQGLAPGPGGAGDNVFSALSSCGGGLVAFTEVSPGGGWRIRFCDDLVWDDGPGDVLQGIDLQGVAVNQYGRALGLGSSAVAGASMAPGTPPLEARSIEGDDAAGLQFQYGAAGPAKPRVADVVVGPGGVLVTGSGFAPAGNEVWLPQPGGDGTPLVVSGLASTGGGTTLQLAVPAASGPGDLLVKVPGAGGSTLSNAHPYDPAGTPPTTYCSAKTSSLGCLPSIGWTGAPSVSATAPFRLIGSDVVPDEFGLVLYGTNGRANLSFHGGKLCVKAPVTRTLPPKSSGSPGSPPCAGVLRVDFGARIQSGVDPQLVPGQTVRAQWLYRDPGVDAFGDGLTDAIEFTVTP